MIAYCANKFTAIAGCIAIVIEAVESGSRKLFGFASATAGADACLFAIFATSGRFGGFPITKGVRMIFLERILAYQCVISRSITGKIIVICDDFILMLFVFVQGFDSDFIFTNSQFRLFLNFAVAVDKQLNIAVSGCNQAIFVGDGDIKKYLFTTIFQFNLVNGCRYLIFSFNGCFGNRITQHIDVFDFFAICVFDITNGVLNNTARVAYIELNDFYLVGGTCIKHIACKHLPVDDKGNDLKFARIANANISIYVLILRNV